MSPTKGASDHTDTYPMCIPASLDYGSVFLRMTFKGRNLQIKVYPRLVHVIKSFNSQIQGKYPKTSFAVRSKSRSIVEMINNLASVTPAHFGGLWMEVTVQSAILAEACAFVEASPFLDLAFWRNPPPGMERFKLEFKVAPQKTIIANANWIYQQAMSQGLFSGDDSRRPSPKQLRALNDVMCGFGWNAGVRHITKLADVFAWWRDSDTDPEALETISTISAINQLYQDKARKIVLIELVQSRPQEPFFPCRKKPNDAGHRYHVVARLPFRLRCYNNSCRDNLPMGQAVRWIANLIVIGQISRSDVKLRSTEQAGPLPRLGNQQASAPPSIPDIRLLVRHSLCPAWYSTQWTDPNGNCMFEAFAKAIGQNGLNAATTRKTATDWLIGNRSQVEHLTIPSAQRPNFNFNIYLGEMATSGTFGESIALFALCSAYNVKAKVLKKTDSTYSWLPAGNDAASRTIHLYLENKHYENLFGAAKVAGL